MPLVQYLFALRYAFGCPLPKLLSGLCESDSIVRQATCTDKIRKGELERKAESYSGAGENPVPEQERILFRSCEITDPPVLLYVMIVPLEWLRGDSHQR